MKFGKTLKVYRNAKLTTCGYKKHKKGCYIQLKEDKTTNSEQIYTIIDYNKKGEIIGIEIYDIRK